MMICRPVKAVAYLMTVLLMFGSVRSRAAGSSCDNDAMLGSLSELIDRILTSEGIEKPKPKRTQPRAVVTADDEPLVAREEKPKPKPQPKPVAKQEPPAEKSVRTCEDAPKYFMFASNASGHGITPAGIKRMVAKYGPNILVGADIGDGSFNQVMAAAKAAGAKRHVYLEGPGGPTGGTWNPAELARAKKYASQTKGGWANWTKSGWKEHTRRQILSFSKQGVHSIEIDNMDRAVGIGESASGMVAFLIEQERWMKQNGVKTRLMLKNQSPGQLRAIASAIKAGKLDREILADFHIAEKGTGNRQQQADIAKQMGIKTIFSNNTHDYDAKGEYGLAKKCSAKAGDRRVAGQ